MAFTTNVTSKGGDKLKAALAKAEKNNGKRTRIKVGFQGGIPDADGTTSANIAAIQEFGDPGRSIPERPFFRQSINDMAQRLPAVVQRAVKPDSLEIGPREAAIIGEWAVDVVQEHIVDLRDPPNAPYTLSRKQEDSPLVDTGKMVNDVSWELET